EHFADRLHAACREKGAPVCVGLDPVFDRLPDELKQAGNEVQAIETFCHEVIDAVAPHVPCIKVQSACFERYRAPGFEAMFRVIEAARRPGLVVILDAKRGDIGLSASHYAAGLLEGAPGVDALTVHSYLGDDSLQPFIDVAARTGKGLFPLVRTSNPGGDGLQGLTLQDGRTVAEAVADMVTQLGAQAGCVSASGYSLLGAVVGATKPTEFVALRRQMWRQVFLVPGFGAQGGALESLRHCFHADGTGALVSASRSVIFAYQDSADASWRDAVATAARDLHEQIAALLASGAAEH
ncbi:MAG: orotidine-5'-phosphate decarboxylase, partial [Phycisphaeraceae bacterium]